jgi:hypothetical protein
MWIQNKFIVFLEENQLYPVNEYTWNAFEIVHEKPKTEKERQDVKKLIDIQVGKKNGLYAYKDMNDNVLYIGKAKPLRIRLLSHYRESFEEVPGDTKDKRWHRFFSSKQGKLKVFWIEVEGEESRRIVEQMLDFVIKPKFREFK